MPSSRPSVHAPASQGSGGSMADSDLLVNEVHGAYIVAHAKVFPLRSLLIWCAACSTSPGMPGQRSAGHHGGSPYRRC
jgi:hypothetical protein